MTPLTDPRVRLAAGTVALLVTATAARRGRVGPGEAARTISCTPQHPGGHCPEVA